MKVLERVIEGRLRKIVRIYSMQFVFMGREEHDRCYFHSLSAAGEIPGEE